MSLNASQGLGPMSPLCSHPQDVFDHFYRIRKVQSFKTFFFLILLKDFWTTFHSASLSHPALSSPPQTDTASSSLQKSSCQPLALLNILNSSTRGSNSFPAWTPRSPTSQHDLKPAQCQLEVGGRRPWDNQRVRTPLCGQKLHVISRICDKLKIQTMPHKMNRIDIKKHFKGQACVLAVCRCTPPSARCSCVLSTGGSVSNVELPVSYSGLCKGTTSPPSLSANIWNRLQDRKVKVIRSFSKYRQSFYPHRQQSNSRKHCALSK